ASGQPWSVQVNGMNVARAEQAQSGTFQEVTVHLLLTPPANASARRMTLNYDVIMHQVVTHKALVSVHSDWGGGRVEPTQLGVIAVDTGSQLVTPLAIDLGNGNWQTGFLHMITLGMEHIRAGLDHLLFLLVLLLPAT